MAIDVDAAANDPKRQRVNEEGEVEQHSLGDIIKAAKYEDAKADKATAKKRPPYGVHMSRLVGGPLGQ